MARKSSAGLERDRLERGRASEQSGEERRTPFAVTVGLLVGFVVLAVVGVVTVVLPEITDDGDDETDEPAAAAEAPRADDGPAVAPAVP